MLKNTFLFSCIGRRSYIIDYFKDLDPSIHAIGTSNTQTSPALKSCDKACLLPDIIAENYIDKLLEVCQKEQVNALLSFLDLDTFVLSKHLKEIQSTGCVPLVSGFETSRICFDKYETFKFLNTHDMPTPQTYIDLDQVKEGLSSNKLSFPVIAKPRKGFNSRGVKIVHNWEELEEAISHIHFLEDDFIIQDFIEGKEYDFDMLCDLEGDVISIVPWEKLSYRGGEVDQSVTVKDERITELGLKLASALKFTGPVDVDVIYNRNSDDYYIIEINPRFGGGYPSSHLAGANFPEHILRLINGKTVSGQLGNYEVDSVMVKEIKPTKGWVDNKKVTNYAI